MSLFNDLQWEIIERPRTTWAYHRILKEKNKGEQKERKELMKEKRKELPPEEYKKRWQVNHYKRKRKEIIEKTRKRRKEDKEDMNKFLEEIYEEVYWDRGGANRDEYYYKKYFNDDTDSEWRHRYYRRASRMRWLMPSKLKKIEYPIRILERKWMKEMFTSKSKIQDDAYKCLKPHIGEITMSDLKIAGKQFFTKSPMRVTKGKMQELANNSWIPKNQLCCVASAMLRDKYICSELYLWPVSYLIGDVIISQGGNIFRPILGNSLPWLTKETVEELHEKRMKYLKKENDDVPIYVLRDAYLIKIPVNKLENLFYIVPT